MLKEEIRYNINLIKEIKVISNYKYRKKNIFKTNYNKNVLISYIIEPFKSSKVNNTHSNFQEVVEIAKIFNLEGYNVDVYYYLYKPLIDYSKYDVIFGFGFPIENSFNSNFDGKRIYYATGAHNYFQNMQEIKRVIEFKERNGKLLKTRRIIKNPWILSSELSDAIICIGNSWTTSTYSNNNIYKVSVTTCNKNYMHIPKQWNNVRNNFLWVGGAGCLHKGLDKCIEAFTKINKKLYICCKVEEDFFQYYKNDIENNENIEYVGFLDIEGEEFLKLTQKCAYVISPSCSEGQSSAVITAMSYGLIPLMTKETGIDFGNYGYEIEDVNKIEKTIKKLDKEKNETLCLRSKLSQEYCINNNTLEEYINNMHKILKNILKEFINS